MHSHKDLIFRTIEKNGVNGLVNKILICLIGFEAQ